MSDKPEVLSAKIIREAELFLSLYQAVLTAGRETIEDSRVINARNNVCVLPLEQKGITRSVLPLHIPQARMLHEPPIVTFNPAHLTVVGGCALAAYDFHIGGDYTKYISTPTPDMDIVWWPEIDVYSDAVQKSFFQRRMLDQIMQANFLKVDLPLSRQQLISRSTHHQNFAITSLSPAIVTLAMVMQEKLKKSLTAFVTAYATVISNMLAHGNASLRTSVEHKHVYRAGVHNLTGIIYINDRPLKILDVTIHDGASSQISQKLEHMITDEIYCHPQNGIRFLQFMYGGFRTVHMAVPFYSNFVNQQSLALRNRVQQYWDGRIDPEKAKVHAARIRYIYDMLEATRDPTHPSRSRILSVLGIPYVNDKYFDHLQAFLFESIDAIAACPWTLAKCRLSPTSGTVIALCDEDRMLNKKLCSGVPRVLPRNFKMPPEISVPPAEIHVKSGKKLAAPTPYSTPMLSASSTAFVTPITSIDNNNNTSNHFGTPTYLETPVSPKTPSSRSRTSVRSRRSRSAKRTKSSPTRHSNYPIGLSRPTPTRKHKHKNAKKMANHLISKTRKSQTLKMD
jgi:hypothetical protein